MFSKSLGVLGLAGGLYINSQNQQTTSCTEDQKKDFDAIIIGAGHNGLVAANYLAL